MSLFFRSCAARPAQLGSGFDGFAIALDGTNAAVLIRPLQS
jgi:hypothetical protein